MGGSISLLSTKLKKYMVYILSFLLTIIVSILLARTKIKPLYAIIIIIAFIVIKDGVLIYFNLM